MNMTIPMVALYIALGLCVFAFLLTILPRGRGKWRL
jgi:hypothetical protein